MITKIRIQNFKSIVDTTIEFNDLIYVLAGQNEAGKSSILEAIHAFEEQIIDRENLNFEEESNGNTKQSISISFNTNEELFNSFEKECAKLVDENKTKSITDFKLFNNEKLSKLKEFTLTRSIDFEEKDQQEFELKINEQALILIKSSVNGQISEKDDIITTIAKSLVPLIDFNGTKSKIVENLWISCPEIVYFDNVADLLPDEIYIDELVEKDAGKKGIKAVTNFENIIDIDFISLSKKK